MKLSKIELLSPAGNYDSFVAAINAGADAIYMGIERFNARNMAQNFSIDEFIKCIKYAHIRDVKVYLTLNTLLYDNEIKQAMDLVIELYSKGLDAVIIQDLGLAMAIKEILPEISLHASTQMSVHNLEGAKYLESLGFKRIVLARELSIAEIEYICKNVNIEIEVFVHGALCVCVSGQCQMSSLIGDRSANRGNCAQPCRMKYSLYRNNEKTPIIKEKYLLSKKDIFGLDIIEKLTKAGVTSFKIEGRNRSSEYVAEVTRAYRSCIDNNYIYDDKTKKEVLQLFNRSGESNGYLNGIEDKESISINTPKNTGIILGNVLEYKKPYVKLKLLEQIDMHDGIDIYDNGNIVSALVTCIKDNKGIVINKQCKKQDIVWIGDVKQKVNIGSNIFKTMDSKLNEELNKEYIKKIYFRKKNINIDVYVTKSEFSVNAIINNKKIQVKSSYIPEISKTTSVDEQNIKDTFSKVVDIPYIFNIQKMVIDKGLFVPKSEMNNLRRMLLIELERTSETNIDVDSNKKNLLEYIQNINKYKENKNGNRSINSFLPYKYNKNIDYIEYFRNKYNTKMDRIYIGLYDILQNEIDIISKYINKIEIYILLPSVKFIKNTYEDRVENLIQKGIMGLCISSLADIDFGKRMKKEYKISLVANYSLNILNSTTAKWYKDQGFDMVTIGVDINEDEIEQIKKIIDVEVVEGVIAAMTSRYCMVKTFATSECKNCNLECNKNNYYILDSYNKKYDIICDIQNHTMTLIRNNSKKISNKEGLSIRKQEI